MNRIINTVLNEETPEDLGVVVMLTGLLRRRKVDDLAGIGVSFFFRINNNLDYEEVIKMRDIVKNKDGNFYLISSKWTDDCGYETMIFYIARDFEGIKKMGLSLRDVVDWSDLYCERYRNEEDMIRRHKELVDKMPNADIITKIKCYTEEDRILMI